ncbi:hypothetical protein [Thermocatellispora tengchongensis]|nr:hypothetical protein [Thermocatellispora tengchongensis]
MPAFHERLVSVLLPLYEAYGLVLAGGYAMKAHGFLDRPGDDLAFATGRSRPPLPEIAHGVADAFRADGLEVAMPEVNARLGRLIVTEPVTGERCELHLLREALQQPPVRCGDVPVVAANDAVGLQLRALHERSLARDLIDVAAVRDHYTFRELEHLARLHNEEFSLAELVMRLEFAELIGDEEFFGYGVDEEQVADIRRFAREWVEDIKLRRTDDGDTEGYDFDVPDPD